MVTKRLSFLHNSYEKKCNVNKSRHSSAAAPAQEVPPTQSPSEVVMDKINKFVSNEMQLPIDSYLWACGKINDENWAKIVLKMNEPIFHK